MPSYFSLALVVGVLAVVATWIFGLPVAAENNLQVWIAFIAWGGHFHCGGKFSGTRDTVLCMTFGAVVGLASILLAHQLGALGSFAAPVAVGVGAAVICLASKVPYLGTIPASVYGFASIAGVVLLSGSDGSLWDRPQDAFLPTFISIVIGGIFGYVSEQLTAAISKKA